MFNQARTLDLAQRSNEVYVQPYSVSAAIGQKPDETVSNSATNQKSVTEEDKITLAAAQRPGDNCLFGDKKGKVFSSGWSCADMVRLAPNNCPAVPIDCCESCAPPTTTTSSSTSQSPTTITSPKTTIPTTTTITTTTTRHTTTIPRTSIPTTTIPTMTTMPIQTTQTTTTTATSRPSTATKTTTTKAATSTNSVRHWR
ncbi:unnamed protein product [Mytilus coruscus]|uniref:Uncharacterized protein n=1 Tax=Mytilus coruscus TaxID=42192 RepID=A0A6J8AII8_MYTCO|nr:unnamed protein product [Mytilus coruscus]